MTDIVFLEPNKIDSEPFTTSDVVADVTGISHRRIKSAIVKHADALESFGKVVQYGTTLGGRGNEAGYRLNEQQATLLITFLKNTPAVVEFKVELVRQFYAMRSELNQRSVERSQLKVALHITVSGYYDSQIRNMIEEAKRELVRAGVADEIAAEEEDPLVRSAIKAYCQMRMTEDPGRHEIFSNSFAYQQDCLRKSGGYRA